MTRGAGHTRGYRAQDSQLRPGKTVVAFGERTAICPACRQHKHQGCWAFLAALGLGGEAGCPCDCHLAPDDPLLTDEAIDDMAAHNTLADHVKVQQAWARGSGPIHFGDVCRRCAAVQGYRSGQQTQIPIGPES